MTEASFAKRLKYKREKAGLSMKEVARLIGVSESTYREWEYGREIRGEKPYEKLALVLQTSLSELVTGKTSKSASISQGISLIEEGLRLIKRAEK